MPRARAATTVEDVMAKINARWPGAMTLANDPKLAVRRIPTGIIEIDWLTGGGFALNRHTELFGGKNVGKTNTVYRFIANGQRLGYKCAYMDVEKSFDPRFAEHAGVDLALLEMPKHIHAERLVDIMEVMLRSGQYGIIVLDSIASLLPKIELEGDMEVRSMGMERAKLMSKALARLTTANSDTALIYINQTRDSMQAFAKAAKPGGRAMGFYAGQQLEFVQTETIKAKKRVINPSSGVSSKADRPIGHRLLVRLDKDKTGGNTPLETVSLVFNYRQKAFDETEGLMYLGRVLGMVKKSGNSWWLVGYEEEKCSSRGRFKSWLRSNRAVAEELQEQIESSSNEEEQVEDDSDED